MLERSNAVSILGGYDLIWGQYLYLHMQDQLTFWPDIWLTMKLYCVLNDTKEWGDELLVASYCWESFTVKGDHSSILCSPITPCDHLVRSVLFKETVNKGTIKFHRTAHESTTSWHDRQKSLCFWWCAASIIWYDPFLYEKSPYIIVTKNNYFGQRKCYCFISLGVVSGCLMFSHSILILVA